MGGLGHIAVMYAKAMGCDAVVLSSNEGKREDAKALGAVEFYKTPVGKEQAGIIKGINVLLLCGSELPDFDWVMPILARRATIVPLIIQGEPLRIP